MHVYRDDIPMYLDHNPSVHFHDLSHCYICKRVLALGNPHVSSPLSPLSFGSYSWRGLYPHYRWLLGVARKRKLCQTTYGKESVSISNQGLVLCIWRKLQWNTGPRRYVYDSWRCEMSFFYRS